MLQSRYLNEDDLKDFGFKAIGRNVRISTDARIYGQKNISIGDNVRIDDFATLVAVSGFIRIGDYASIMRGCHLSGVFGIELEPFSHLAANCVLYSASDDFKGNCMTTVTVPAEFLKYVGGKITLGRHAIIGGGCTVLGPTMIGQGAAVGAMSMVNADLAPWRVYAGVPAKDRGPREPGALDLEKRLKAA